MAAENEASIIGVEAIVSLVRVLPRSALGTGKPVLQSRSSATHHPFTFSRSRGSREAVGDPRPCQHQPRLAPGCQEMG
jgi:hypothetical protein